MAKSCPDCGFSNEDSRIFCGSCGEPLGGEERLIRDLERMKAQKAEEAKNPKPKTDKPLQARTSKDDDDYVPTKAKKDDTAVNLSLVILGILAVFLLTIAGWGVITHM